MQLKRLGIVLGAVAFILVAGGPSIYFYGKYKEAQNLLQNPNLATKQQVAGLVEKVGKLIELPAGEEPTVASVADKEKLKDQSFFARAENGDKVLIFAQAKKAILYRESTNKVIEVAPITLGQSTQAVPTSAQSMPVKVAFYNGTTTTGLTKVAAQKLGGKMGFEVVLRKDASGTYEKTVVVSLSASSSASANQLAATFGGMVVTLPIGEAKPDGADVLVILGKDFALANP